jgi:hypothetical protein
MLIYIKKKKSSRGKLISLIDLYHSERIKLFIHHTIAGARKPNGTKKYTPCPKGAGKNGKVCRNYV